MALLLLLIYLVYGSVTLTFIARLSIIVHVNFSEHQTFRSSLENTHAL